MAIHQGLVLGPASSKRCDDDKVGIGSVRWDTIKSRWLMLYYCRDKEFDSDAPSNLGTGRIAAAESSDGIKWQRIKGSGPLGSVIDRGQSQDDYDCLHIGMTDVTLVNGTWWMWCFGGGKEILESDFGPIAGLRMRPGIVRSEDGVNWTKIKGAGPGGSSFDHNEGDIFASWTNGLHDGKQFIMYYTAVNSPAGPFRTEFATSSNAVNWEKKGEIHWLDGTRPWDSGGIMTRHIQPNPLSTPEKWLMAYTGLDGRPDKSMKRTIGIALSDDGIGWKHLYDEPVFVSDDPDAWDGGGVSAPQLVFRDDEVYMYYFGFPDPKNEKSPPKGVGLAISKNNDLKNFKRI